VSRQQDPIRQQPSVGDTVTIVHRVAAPTDALVQPRPPLDSLLATLVGPPAVAREGDSVRIAYTVSVWSPGQHRLTIPGPVLLHADGRVDTLADSRVLLDVASVLPTGIAAESLPVRQARPWVARAETSLFPFAVLLLPVLLLLAAAALWWRRRGPEMISRAMPVTPMDAHLRRIIAWREVGEPALAVDHLGGLLPATPAAAAWRERVAAVRFRADGQAELSALLEEGIALLDSQDATA
jgi:hypothetical protein